MVGKKNMKYNTLSIFFNEFYSHFCNPLEDQIYIDVGQLFKV